MPASEPEFSATVVDADIAQPEPAETPTEATTATPATPAPADPEPEPKDTGTEKPDPGQDAAAERDKPSRTEKRIDKLTRRLREAERTAAYWQGRASAQSASPAHGAQQGEVPKDVRPTAEDFESVDEYADALADWKVRKQAPEQPARKPADEPDAAPPRGPDDFARSIEAARAKYDDLHEVLFDPDIPISQHMVDAVSDLDNAAEVLYHLARDEDELERIAALSPRKQARELWRFAETLSAGTGGSAPGQKPDRETQQPAGEPRARMQPSGNAATRAQPVPRFLDGSSGGAAVVDPYDLPDDQFYEVATQRDIKAGRRPW